MKFRIFLASLLVAVAVCLPASVFADSGPSFSGGGSTPVPGLGLVTFGLTAVTHQDGTVAGEFLVRVAGTADTIKADVQCLDVQGNIATIGGFVSRGTLNGSDLTGLCYAAAGQDNGEGQNSPPDLVSFVAFAPCSVFPPETACSSLILPVVLEVDGNLHLRP